MSLHPALAARPRFSLRLYSRMPSLQYLAAGAIVFGAFFVRGFSGFGAVLFALPLLAFWMPVKVVVPLLAALSIANGLWLAWRARARLQAPELARLLAGGLPGIAAGVLLFASSPDRTLRSLLGVLVLLCGAWLAWPGPGAGRHWPRPAGVGAGFAGGLLGGLFGVAGPPAVLYLAARPVGHQEFRATLLVFLLVIDVLRGGAYAAGGSLSAGTWLTGLALFPLSLLGSWCGERLQARVSDRTFRRIAALFLALMGAVLMVPGRGS